MIYEIAEYIIATECTVRKAARHFNVSRTTVHDLMVKRLPKESSLLANKVARILARNKAERHLRGGQATKEKWRKVHVQCNKDHNVRCGPHAFGL